MDSNNNKHAESSRKFWTEKWGKKQREKKTCMRSLCFMPPFVSAHAYNLLELKIMQGPALKAKDVVFSHDFCQCNYIRTRNCCHLPYFFRKKKDSMYS